MAYYDTVRSPADFRRIASNKNARNFQTLLASADWKTAASSWGADHLFACRVVCRKPSRILPLIYDTVEGLKRDKDEWHSVIQNLINGPREGIPILSRMSDTKILQAYQTDILGPLWGSLSKLVHTSLPTPNRQLRERNRAQSSQPQNPLSRESSQVSTPSAADSAPSSIGYQEPELSPSVEDLTVRFSGEFIRFVLCFCQSSDKVSQIEYRVTRIAHWGEGSRWCAIDDGGFEVTQGIRKYQVAILEAKRSFQTFNNGRPAISDRLLGQLVGEAMGVLASRASIFNGRVFVILAIKYFVKFFSFEVSQQFMSQFKTMNPAAHTGWDTYLAVDSTDWLDATDPRARLDIVSHIMALVDCADEVVSPPEDE